MKPDVMKDYEDQIWDLAGTMQGTEGVRVRALSEAEALGVPTRKTEDWRYSDVRALRDGVFAAPKSVNVAEVAAPLTPETSARFVFINGRLHEELSSLGDLWQAAQVRPLANHFMSNMDRVDELVRGQDFIGLMNTALFRDGMVISVPAGVEIDDPVEIIHVMTGAEGSAAQLRHMVELGEGASLSIIERYVGDDSAYWTNAVLQARVAEGASFHHVRLQDDGAGALHTSRAYVNLDADARYTCSSVSLGGHVARFDAFVRLLGEGAHATVDGVALAGTGQSHDTYTHMRHTVPGATSDQIFRTVADSRGKTSFQGKVTVEKDAQQTAADQSFKALVFDRTAEANAKPELEILADDVKCSHGATVGELDEKAIFYLTSRGIDPATARQMLVEAFTGDAIARVADDDVREALMDRIAAWMKSRTHRPDATGPDATGNE